MNIYDIATITDQDLLTRGRATLDRFPVLQRIYREDFVRALIRYARRQGYGNWLLLLLVQPGDEYADEVWTSIIADLEILAPERSFEHDLRRVSPQDVLHAEIRLTAVGGKVVYEGHEPPNRTAELPNRSADACACHKYARAFA